MHDYSTNSPHGALYWTLALVLCDSRWRCAPLDPIRPYGGPVTLCDGPSGPGLVTLAVQGGACFLPNGDVWGPHELWPDTCVPDDTRPVCCPWRLCDATSETAPRPDLDGLLAVFWGEARGATALFLGYTRAEGKAPPAGRCWGDDGLPTTAAHCSTS